MKIRKLSIVLAMTPMMCASVAVSAEKGVVYDAAGMAWRTSYGECWTTLYRDKDPADSGCFAAEDEDGDGVEDSKDQCPGTPAGTEVDAKGCALDTDGDGVSDASDQCPGTPAGAQVDARGCEFDSDGDGVVDSRDACPNTPEGATVDERGCALGIVLRNVHFRLNSGELAEESKAILDKVASSLKARGDIRSILVIGHTDNTGEASYNLMLSEKRAKSVADYLVSQGVDGAILSAKGMGMNAPVADNATSQGRAKNRRVELKLN